MIEIHKARHVPLVAAFRGSTAESVHYGSIAVVDAHGGLRCALGEVDALVFARSALKPLQIAALVAHPQFGRFGFEPREIAVFCGSHSGEPRHAETVLAALQKIGCRKEDLQCGVHVPLYYEALGRKPLREEVFTPLHNNCSGKHAAMLALCRLLEAPIDSYLAIDHPVQCAIRAAIARFTGLAESQLRAGVDGCGAPTYAFPLRRLAGAFAALATGDGAGPCGGAAQHIYAAMATHPEMSSGLRRLDLALSTAGGGAWIAKTGAEGVEAVAVRTQGWGIAVKIADGSARARNLATVELMRQLGLLGKIEGTALEEIAAPPIDNWQGRTVGGLRPLFQIQ